MLRDWIIIATVILVLYALWMFMQFVFDMIDRAHALRRDPSLETPGRSSRSERTD